MICTMLTVVVAYPQGNFILPSYAISPPKERCKSSYSLFSISIVTSTLRFVYFITFCDTKFSHV